jgi:hypothetical protein
MMVWQLDEMPADEFMRWGVYFSRLAQREQMAAMRARR